MKPSSCKKVTSTIQRNTKMENDERKMDEDDDSPISLSAIRMELLPKPKPGERPRAIIARFHYYSDKEKNLKLLRKAVSTTRDHRYTSSPI